MARVSFWMAVRRGRRAVCFMARSSCRPRSVNPSTRRYCGPSWAPWRKGQSGPDSRNCHRIRRIREGEYRRVRTWSNLPIIVISARSEDTDKIDALDAGADDYLTKPFNILELKARIRALLRRAGTAKKQTPEQTLVCGHITLDRSSRSAFREDVPVDLTAKEFDLMELLMRNPNRVYSRETLLDAIWGYDVSSEIRTVDVHIRRLREKLEKNPAQPEHILTKWGVGYYFKY